MSRNARLEAVAVPDLPPPLGEYQPADLRPPVKLSPPINASALRFFDTESLSALDRPGFFVRDNFSGDPGMAAAVHMELSRLHAEGKLASTRMVNRAADGTIEKWDDHDKNLWLNNKQKVADLQCPKLVELLFKLNDLRKELNDVCAFASTSVQTQAAVYENGAGYARRTAGNISKRSHMADLDATVTGTARRITCLYYCNPFWKPGDGGELRVFVSGGVVDVQPMADRLLVFQSASVEHQVLPAQRPRFALTMWFY